MRHGGERADHRHLADVALAEIALQPPDRDDDLRRHPEPLLDPRQQCGVTLQHLPSHIDPPGPTRVETYCSKVLLKVPRWRRSKFSTAGSCVTPESACEITAGETPAACASADIAATKVLKSPPHRAARAGVAMTVANKMAKQNLRMRIPCGLLAPIMP